MTMDAATRRLIEAIHRSPCPCVLAVTGGGAGAVAALLSVPGASRSVLEAIVPYHEQALADFLRYRPAQFCSVETSREMARRAYERAQWLAPGQRVAGVGCTATLATDRPKKGAHRFHLAFRHDDRTLTCSLTLGKGARDRAGEEAVLDAVLLNGLADLAGVVEKLPVPLLPGEELLVEPFAGTDALALLLRGEVSAVHVATDGRLSAQAPMPRVLLPGSFNPVHEGHWGLAAAAARLTGQAVAFELSVQNVDKPPLPAEEVRRRLQQFAWRAPVWLTKLPTFAEKAMVFPGVVFVIGADTAERLVASRYYQDSEARMAEALGFLRSQACRFLVACRTDRTGNCVGLDELAIPAEFRDLFLAIPKSEFHLPLSSTELRERSQSSPGVAEPPQGA